MERNKFQRALSAAWPRVLAIGILLAIWQVLVIAGVRSPGDARLPGPGDAISEIGYLTHIGVLLPALVQTLERAAIGYVLALVLGTLVGLAVVTTSGEPVGVVTDVRHHGQDLLVIQPAGPRRDGLLVPFVAAIVPEIDVKAGRLVIDPPPGLLDPENHGPF